MYVTWNQAPTKAVLEARSLATSQTLSDQLHHHQHHHRAELALLPPNLRLPNPHLMATCLKHPNPPILQQLDAAHHTRPEPPPVRGSMSYLDLLPSSARWAHWVIATVFSSWHFIKEFNTHLSGFQGKYTTINKSQCFISQIQVHTSKDCIQSLLD